MAANQTVTEYGTILPNYISDAPRSKKKEIFGLNFPLGSEPRGYFSKKSGIAMIRNSVKQLLLTERGERLMLPDYGCSLRRFVFQPLDEFTFDEIKTDILDSFNKYIVGATIQKLGVFPTGDIGPAGGNSLKVVLSLKLDSTDLQIFDVEATIS